jgi:hypothetical protein
MPAGEFEERVVAHGSQKTAKPPGRRTRKTSRAAVQVEVVQDGVAPDAVEAGVGERSRSASAWRKFTVTPLARSRGASATYPADRSKAVTRPAASQHDGGHAVTAAVVEHVEAADISQAVEGRPYPACVVEIGTIRESEQAG